MGHIQQRIGPGSRPAEVMPYDHEEPDEEGRPRLAGYIAWYKDNPAVQVTGDSIGEAVDALQGVA